MTLHSLPEDRLGIVMRKVENKPNYYDIWFEELRTSMIRSESSTPLEPGQWVENEKGKLKLAEPPVKVDRIKRQGENSLFKLTTRMVKPEDEYFQSERIDPGVQKYQKYVGLSTDFGTVFVNKKIGIRMKPGVLYNVEICNFALLQNHQEKDFRILQVMKAMGTLWLATNFEREQSLDVIVVDSEEWNVAKEDMMNAHGYILKRHVEEKQKDDPCRALPNRAAPLDSHASRNCLPQLSATGMRSFKNAPQERTVYSDFNEQQFIHSLTKLFTNRKIRKAILQMNGTEPLKFVDEFLRNPPRLSFTTSSTF